MSTKAFASYFISRGLLTPEEWAEYSSRANSSGKNVANLLAQEKKASPHQIYEATAVARGWKFQPLSNIGAIPTEVIDLIEASDARDLQVMPISVNGRELTVATVNPGDVNLNKNLRGKTGHSIQLVFTPPDELKRVIGTYYSTSAEAAKKGAIAAKSLVQTGREAMAIADTGDEGEIARTLNVIIEGAIRSGASDIHLEPGQTHLHIRYEVDGKLRAEPKQSLAIAPRLAALIKTRAKLKTSSLTDQNGVIEHTYNGRNYDLRVAVLPEAWGGESITLRMADDQIRDLSTLGFEPDNEARWRRALEQPNGLLLAVGPMGSGKTQLNYASLKHQMRHRDRKIVSLEAPVEVKIPDGITQVSLNPEQGLDWDAMSTVLRSAAKVLFIGEINKDPIAKTAIDAALTGHLVLSTLHTNDAPGAVVRLREMGIRPSVLSDSLRAVCAQRLPRLLCTECKVKAMPDREMILDFKLSRELLNDTDWYGPSRDGCPACNNMGYKGRAPIHELMTFPREVRDLVTSDASVGAITEAAKAAGMRTLQEDGMLKVRAGATSLEELRRHILID